MIAERLDIKRDGAEVPIETVHERQGLALWLVVHLCVAELRYAYEGCLESRGVWLQLGIGRRKIRLRRIRLSAVSIIYDCSCASRERIMPIVSQRFVLGFCIYTCVPGASIGREREGAEGREERERSVSVGVGATLVRDGESGENPCTSRPNMSWFGDLLEERGEAL